MIEIDRQDQIVVNDHINAEQAITQIDAVQIDQNIQMVHQTNLHVPVVVNEVTIRLVVQLHKRQRENIGLDQV